MLVGAAAVLLYRHHDGCSCCAIYMYLSVYPHLYLCIFGSPEGVSLFLWCPLFFLPRSYRYSHISGMALCFCLFPHERRDVYMYVSVYQPICLSTILSIYLSIPSCFFLSLSSLSYREWCMGVITPQRYTY